MLKLHLLFLTSQAVVLKMVYSSLVNNSVVLFSGEELYGFFFVKPKQQTNLSEFIYVFITFLITS